MSLTTSEHDARARVIDENYKKVAFEILFLLHFF